MDRFRTEMNDLFSRIHPSEAWRSLAFAYPPVNVWEDEQNLFAEAELPGMAMDKIEIYVTEGNQLTIQGERTPVEVKNGVWHRQERTFGKFSRVIALPVAVDAIKVEARFENGVLRLTLPKSEAAKPRKIAVKGEG
jgi:HSP20 family protein